MPKAKPKKSIKKPLKKGIKKGRNNKGQFVKGEYNGGPGRPEGSFSLLSLLKVELQKVPKEYKKDKKTYANLIIKRMLADAIKKGDDAKIRLIWNYIEGMPKQSVDLTSKGEKLFDDETKKAGEKSIKDFLGKDNREG